MTVSSRFSTSTLHQRDPRSALFDSYTGDRNRTSSNSPARGGSGYGYAAGSGVGVGGSGMGQVNGGFRAATPNSRYVQAHARETRTSFGHIFTLCGMKWHGEFAGLEGLRRRPRADVLHGVLQRPIQRRRPLRTREPERQRIGRHQCQGQDAERRSPPHSLLDPTLHLDITS